MTMNLSPIAFSHHKNFDAAKRTVKSALVAKFIAEHKWSEVRVHAALLFVGDNSALL